jgi:ATP synthase protein I
MSDEPEHPCRLENAVRARRKRRALWEEKGERPIGRNLALIGVLGWTVVTPTLAGLFAGRWLDRHLGSGIFWTLGLLTGGVALGCALAWKRIGKE